MLSIPTRSCNFEKMTFKESWSELEFYNIMQSLKLVKLVGYRGLTSSVCGSGHSRYGKIIILPN